MKIKNIQLINYLILTIVLISACKKNKDAEISKVVQVSFPGIELKGPPEDSIVLIPVGGSYADPGAILVDDISQARTDISATSSDIIDTIAGVYYNTYTAKNSNGFETTKKRVIVVYDTAIPEEDYTGTYAHTNGTIVTITKVRPRIFLCDDLYGTFSIPIPLYFVDFGSGIYIPSQPIDPALGQEVHGEGEVTGTSGTFVLDFYGLLRDGLERPRTLTEQ